MASATSLSGSRSTVGPRRSEADPGDRPDGADGVDGVDGIDGAHPDSSSSSSSSAYSRPPSRVGHSSSSGSTSTRARVSAGMLRRPGQPRHPNRPDPSWRGPGPDADPYAIRASTDAWIADGPYRGSISASPVSERLPQIDYGASAYRGPPPPPQRSGTVERPRALSHSALPSLTAEPPPFPSRDRGPPDPRRPLGPSNSTLLRHAAVTSPLSNSSEPDSLSRSPWSPVAADGVAAADYAYVRSPVSMRAEPADVRFNKLPPPILPPLRVPGTSSYESSPSSHAIISPGSTSLGGG